MDNNVVLGAIADGEAAAMGTTCDVLWNILNFVSRSSLFHLTLWIFLKVKILAKTTGDSLTPAIVTSCFTQLYIP